MLTVFELMTPEPVSLKYEAFLFSRGTVQRKRQITEVVKSVSSEVRLSKQLEIFSFPICKMGIIEVPALQEFVKIERGNAYKALRTVLDSLSTCSKYCCYYYYYL